MTRKTRWLVGALAAALSIGPAAAQSSGSSADQGTATYGNTPTREPSEAHGQPQPIQSGTATGTSRSPGPNSENATATSASGRTSESPTTSSNPGSSSESSSSSWKGSKMSASDRVSAAETLAKLHAGNESEIQAGNWVKQHASNDRVKDFAEKMVNDHTKLDKDTMSFAKDHDIDLTSSTASTTAQAQMSKAQAQLDELKGMQGQQLDRAYMRMMVRDHTHDVQEVRSAEKQAKAANQKDLAKLLDKASSKMEKHLQDAQKITHDLSSRQARNPSSSE